MVIYPYAKNDQMYQCPSQKYTQAQMAYTTYPFAYFYNMNSTDGGGCSGRTLGAIQNPSNLIMIADGWGTMDWWSSATNYSNQYRNNATTCRHNNGANFVFADGHGKWSGSLQDSQWTAAMDPD
jgi:prepilin-type processing-associated H-X9-DG protein